MRMMLIAAAALCLSGCGAGGSLPDLFSLPSTASNETLARGAALEIGGVTWDQLTLSNLVSNDDRTSFTVTTANGTSYRCTAAVAFSAVNHMDCSSSGS